MKNLTRKSFIATLLSLPFIGVLFGREKKKTIIGKIVSIKINGEKYDVLRDENIHLRSKPFSPIMRDEQLPFMDSDFPSLVAPRTKRPPPEILIGNGIGGVKYTDDGGLMIYKTASMGPTESTCKSVIKCNRCSYFWPSHIKECPICDKEYAEFVDKFYEEMMKATGLPL